MQAQLIPLDGGEPISLNRQITLVGRKQGMCDLILDAGSVSKLHCLIVKTDGLLFIRDLGSTNGTKVNGQRVTRGALLPGDELAFAGARYRVHLAPGEPDVDPDESTEMIGELPQALRDGPELEALAEESSSDSDVRLLSEEELG